MTSMAPLFNDVSGFNANKQYVLKQKCVFCPRERKLVGCTNPSGVLNGDIPRGGYWSFNPPLGRCPNVNHKWEVTE